MNNNILTILKNRAKAMAQEPEQKNEASALIEVIAFTMLSENYCIESVFVKEVYPLKDFTPLPGVPSYILGIINVRGQILPVVDMKKLFGLPEKGLGELSRVIIIQNEQMEFGILANVVHGIQTIGVEEIKDLPPTVSGLGEEYIMGVTKESLIVLNAKKLLSDKSIIVHSEVF